MTGRFNQHGRMKCWFVYNSLLFLLISSSRPQSSHDNKASVWGLFNCGSHWALLSNATFKGPDREILDNFTSHRHETGWWANVLWSKSALELRGKNSLFAKQQQVHKHATYLNELDNYLKIFPSPRQWAAINEQAALNSGLVYVPETLISPRLTCEYGGGWLAWVEAIDSMYLRRCQAEYKQAVVGAVRMQRGLPAHILIPPSAAINMW